MMYSMNTRIHWKFAVTRMPRATMNVTRSSHRTPTTAIKRLSLAASALIHPKLLRSCRVYAAATSGAAAQKSTFAASWIQPEIQPMCGLSVRLTHEYDAPQFGSWRLR